MPSMRRPPLITTRGLNYWESEDKRDRRLILSVDNALEELNAETGQPIESFGTNGTVDLREGLGRDPKSLTLVQSYNPGRIFGDLLILGSATNEEYASGPGDIRAYNVLSGKLTWTFHTIPHPGEPGYETWPKDAWKTVGGANAWSGMALDEKRGIVFVPTASPKYNFYGANRPGRNLYGDSLLALDARTGKLIWYYQMVHHDIWDYDNATTPMLLTVRHNGRTVDVVAQASKVGFVWVFERETGKPLWPIEERPVQKSDMPGEVTWPTQPFPTKPAPFARQAFTVKDLSPFLEPGERETVRKQILAARNGGLFTPPSLGGHDRDAWQQWWRQLGRSGYRSGKRLLLRDIEGSASHAEVDTCGGAVEVRYTGSAWPCSVRCKLQPVPRQRSQGQASGDPVAGGCGRSSGQ